MSEHKVTPEDRFKVGDDDGKIMIWPDRDGLICVGMEGVDSVSTFVGLTPDELADLADQARRLARKAGAAETPREVAERRALEAVMGLPALIVEELRDLNSDEVDRLLADRDALKAEREQA